jgi:putative hemolysin
MTIAEQISAEEALAATLDQYAGRWVAVCNHVVVNDDETLEGLLEQIAAEQQEDVEVFQVAVDPHAACFF